MCYTHLHRVLYRALAPIYQYKNGHYALTNPVRMFEESIIITHDLCLPVQIMKTLIVAVLLAGVIPLLLGLLFELVIVAPLRVPLDQTPLFYPWQVKRDKPPSYFEATFLRTSC